MLIILLVVHWNTDIVDEPLLDLSEKFNVGRDGKFQGTGKKELIRWDSFLQVASSTDFTVIVRKLLEILKIFWKKFWM